MTAEERADKIDFVWTEYEFDDDKSRAKVAAAIREAEQAARAEEAERIAKLAEELEATYEIRDYDDPEAKAKGGYAVTTHSFAERIRGRVTP